jgi:hypothetical protein
VDRTLNGGAGLSTNASSGLAPTSSRKGRCNTHVTQWRQNRSLVSSGASARINA